MTADLSAYVKKLRDALTQLCTCPDSACFPGDGEMRESYCELSEEAHLLLAEPLPAQHDAQVLREAVREYRRGGLGIHEAPVTLWLLARADAMEAEARKGTAPDEGVLEQERSK